MDWIAALPMYNVTPALARDWRAFLAHVRRHMGPWLDARGDALHIVEPDASLAGFWLRDDLLLSQTCGYPLVHALLGRVQLVSTPAFDVDGCERGEYRSVLVANRRAGVRSLAACRGLRAAFNNTDSNSGMNLLRAAVAPVAAGRDFFASVIETGSHLASLSALRDDHADVAAIDAVTYSFVRDHLPDLAQGVVQLGVTRSAPGLPLIASRRVPRDGIDALAASLDACVAEDPALAKRLKLTGFIRRPLDDYAAILEIETDAAKLGYPRLA